MQIAMAQLAGRAVGIAINPVPTAMRIFPLPIIQEEAVGRPMCIQIQVQACGAIKAQSGNGDHGLSPRPADSKQACWMPSAPWKTLLVPGD